ncbi:unnamed protein product, partial [Meganyctiphanes norvegica]
MQLCASAKSKYGASRLAIYNTNMNISQDGQFQQDKFMDNVDSRFWHIGKNSLITTNIEGHSGNYQGTNEFYKMGGGWGGEKSLKLNEVMLKEALPPTEQIKSINPLLCQIKNKNNDHAASIDTEKKLWLQNHKNGLGVILGIVIKLVYKVILDVRDFLHSDMKVTVKGERELVVEGAPSEGKQGFSHKFLMPQGVLISQTSSVLSSDGVLTIITPKMMQPVKENVSVPIEIKANVTKLQGKDRQKALAASLLKKNIQSKINKQTIEDFKAKVKVEHTSSGSENGEEHNKIISENHVKNKPLSVFENDLKQGFKPIIRRGNFFKDSIFQNNHSQFNNSVKRAVEKSEQKNMDPMEIYRYMRNNNNETSNRAISVTDEPNIYKITIDVREFTKDGEITVKVVHETDLLVEGHFGPQEPGKSFAQTFTLPEHVDSNSISSVLSSDGVLVITGAHKNASKHLASHNASRTNNGFNNPLNTFATPVDLTSPQYTPGSSTPQTPLSSIPTPESLPPLSTLPSGASTPTPFAFPNTAAAMVNSPSSAPSPICLASPVLSPPMSPEPQYTSYTELKIRPCSSSSSNGSEPNTPSTISCSTPSTVILYKLDDNPGDMMEEEEEDMDVDDDSQDGLMSPGPDPASLEETCTCKKGHR